MKIIKLLKKKNLLKTQKLKFRSKSKIKIQIKLMFIHKKT